MDVPNIIFQVKQILKSGGATREFYISDLVTHVIATDIGFPQYAEAKEYNLTIVQVCNHLLSCINTNGATILDKLLRQMHFLCFDLTS